MGVPMDEVVEVSNYVAALDPGLARGLVKEAGLTFENPEYCQAKILLQKSGLSRPFSRNRVTMPRAARRRRAPPEGQYLRVGSTFRATSAGNTSSAVTMRMGRSLPAM